MVSNRFGRLKKSDGDCSPNLYVANCGPAVGLSFESISAAFGVYGEVKGVYDSDETGTRVIVAFSAEASARAAFEALNGKMCSDLNGRVLHIRYSTLKLRNEARDSVPVSLEASEMNIPGLYLWHDFVSCEEEDKLLMDVDNRPWNNLAKRRVQHYGYEFCYDTRNINTNQRMGELPSFLIPVLERITLLPELDAAENVDLDQVTVNEYPPGVGLSPHIDTHSAFEGLIFSLSLAGSCIMEFRRYPDGLWLPRSVTSDATEVACSDSCSSYIRKILYLPRRSMLLLSGEARYAWHHYIPHHKVDIVNGDIVKRESRRVSFTIRKVPSDTKYELSGGFTSMKPHALEDHSVLVRMAGITYSRQQLSQNLRVAVAIRPLETHQHYSVYGHIVSERRHPPSLPSFSINRYKKIEADAFRPTSSGHSPGVGHFEPPFA